MHHCHSTNEMFKDGALKQNISSQVLNMPTGASVVTSVKKILLLDRKTIKAELSYSSRIFTDLSYFWLTDQSPPAHVTYSGSQKAWNSDYLAAWCGVLNEIIIFKIVLAVLFLRGTKR